MIRKILCEVCSLHRYKLTEADLYNHYAERTARVSLITPESHGYEMTGHHIQVHEVSCDNCNLTLHNGHQAVFVTIWKAAGKDSQPEPADWESAYGHIIERQSWRNI